MNNYFYELTPDVVIEAIEESGLNPTGHCMVLNSYENRVYDLMLEDDSHVISKFYRPGRWTKEQIQAEHDFLLELQEDEIPVCAPRLFDDGETIHETNNIYFAIWPRTGGRIPDELNDSDLESIGRLLARIHNAGCCETANSRLCLTGTTYGLNPLSFLVEGKFLPASCRDRYIGAVKEIADIYDTLSRDVPMHRIHGDCHLGNLLRGREGFFFLDFDDFLTGPAVQDIWMLYPARDMEGFRQRDILLDGYRQFREFNPAWLKLIEPLRALRYIHYAAWIARRWNDPAFPHAFPHFGTQEYWEEETASLEDQLNYIYKSDSFSLSNSSHKNDKTEPELTNKDFFWDLDE